MKGLGILAVLVLLIGGAMFALVRPSDADLERIETAIEEHLDAGDEHLSEATRLLGPLRAIKPNIGRLDDDMSRLREEGSQQRAALASFRGERPDAGAHRGTYITARQEARDAALLWRNTAGDLLSRTRVIDAFTRETQPQVQLMLNHVQQMFALRQQAIDAGRTLDPGIALRVDRLRQNALEIQTLARRVYEIGAEDANQGQTLALTVRNELQQVLGDMQAVIKELGG